MLGLEALGELAGTGGCGLALVEGRLLRAVQTVSSNITGHKLVVLVVGEGLRGMIRWRVLVHVLLESTRL